MHVTSRTTRQKSWQSRRQPFSVLADMALKQERVIATLEHLRERHGLSQEQAAQKVGITTRQWQRWESGESMPYGRNLSAVADAFRFPLAQFFEEDELGDALDVSARLERVEAKLDELLDLLRPTETPAEVLEEAARRAREQRQQIAAEQPRTRRRAAGG